MLRQFGKHRTSQNRFDRFCPVFETWLFTTSLVSTIIRPSPAAASGDSSASSHEISPPVVVAAAVVAARELGHTWSGWPQAWRSPWWWRTPTTRTRGRSRKTDGELSSTEWSVRSKPFCRRPLWPGAGLGVAAGAAGDRPGQLSRCF